MNSHLRTSALALTALLAACASAQRAPVTAQPAPVAEDAAPATYDDALVADAALAAPAEASQPASAQGDAPQEQDPAAPLQGAGPWSVGLYSDPGMNHVVLTAIVYQGERAVRGLALGRFPSRCGDGAFNRLVHPRGAETLLGLGCVPNPGLVTGHLTPDLVRVVLRDGALVGEWAGVVRGRVGRWTEAARLALPAGATAQASSRDGAPEPMPPTVRTCHAFPDSCGEAH